MKTFGASGDGGEVMKHFGFSPEGVVDSTKKWLEKSKELVSSIKKNNLAILESQSAESVERNLHYLNYQH